MEKITIFKRHSMAHKILLTLLMLVIIQGAVFFLMLFGGSIQDEIKNSSFATFSDKIENRKTALEEALISKVYKTENYEKILSLCKQQYSNVSSVDEMKVTPELANSLKQLLYNTYSSGAFIIFDNSETTHTGLSIRDTEPTNVSINDGDLFAEFGSSEIIKEIGLTLDYQWKSSITMEDKTDYDFFYKPMDASKQYHMYQPLELAYWSRPYHMNQDDEESISFSFPILDEQHQAYGVIGVQFTLDYLKSILPYEEINDTGGAYSLAYQNEASLKFEPILISGPLYSDYTSTMSFTQTDSKLKIYTLQDKIKDTTNASIHTLNLYNQTSPFIHETWTLIGLVPESIILSAFHGIVSSLLMTVFTTILVGVLATLMFSLYFSKPFVILLKSLHEADPNKPIQLPKVDIEELDQLSNLVEDMSSNIFESSSRLSNIIKLMDLPLGAIEVDTSANKVFCTEKVAELLSFNEEYAQCEYLTREQFQQEHKKFKENVVHFEKESIAEGGTEVYLTQVLDREEKCKWLRFSVMRLDVKTLITINDVTKETLEKQKLEYERNYDVLTNLLNRRAFHETFEDIIKHKDLKFSALILWDLDNLKHINDTYGHDFGDLYIKEAANFFFTLDVNHAISSRMAGDEFLVFLYGIDTREELLKIAQNLHYQMTQQELNLLNNNKIRIRSSAGIAWYPDDGHAYEDLLKHADYAMYTAKHSLKGSIGIFDYQSYKNEYLLFETLEEFNQILDEGLYRFAFQPIVDTLSGEVFGYEALLRPNGKTIKSPLDLLRIAESQSKLKIVEMITFTGALKAFQEQKEAFEDAKIFINSIPNIMLSKKVVKEIQETYHEDLDRLVVEIIESDQITSENLHLKKEIIKKWNASIALDDFGSGYNNDSAILAIHPNYLKIDQELIKNIDQDERRQMIIRNLLQYSKSQHIKVIAEGVETVEELRFLIQEGADYIQGYYLARPAFEVHGIPQEKKETVCSLAKQFHPFK